MKAAPPSCNPSTPAQRSIIANILGHMSQTRELDHRKVFPSKTRANNKSPKEYIFAHMYSHTNEKNYTMHSPNHNLHYSMRPNEHYRTLSSPISPCNILNTLYILPKQLTILPQQFTSNTQLPACLVRHQSQHDANCQDLRIVAMRRCGEPTGHSRCLLCVVAHRVLEPVIEPMCRKV